MGFETDTASFEQMNKSVESVEEGLGSFASTAVKTFGKAAVAVAAFGVAATAATAKFLGGLGDQEIQMEILSRQLWTTQQQAMAFNATLKAMGTNLQDLYLSPTLMQQYAQLEGVAKEMSTPSDYNQVIKQVQDVSLQVKQMKLEAYYALQWVGYYFIKYMSGPITNVKNVLQSINDVIVKNMPTWTKQVAQVMASFMQAGIYIVQALGNVYTWLQKMLSYIPGWAKGIGAALAIISASNPFMLFIEGIGAAILLLDDFKTYLKDPSQSAFPQFWAWVEKIVTAMKQMGVGTTIAKDIQDAFQVLGKTLQNVSNFAKKLFNTFEQNGTIKSYVNAWKLYWQALVNVGNAIGNVITGIGHLFGLFNNTSGQSNMINFFQLLADICIGAMKIVAGTVDEVAGLVNVVGDALHGNWGAAGQVIKSMWTGQNLADAGVMPQSWVATSSKSAFGSSSPSYVYQSSPSTSTVKHITVNANPTITVTGTSNPYATSNAIVNGFNKNIHNIKGIIQ